MTNPALTVLREFSMFLRRPQVLVPGGWRAPGNLARWAWLTALLIAVLLLVLLPFLRFWQRTYELSPPSAFGALPEGWLIPTVVIVAPIAEELLFRGWQRGTPRALWLLLCGLVGVVAIALAQSMALLSVGLFAVALIAAPLGWFWMRRRAAPLGWFARGYPAIFYLAAALFSLVHLSNYPAFSLAAVPLVLPQFWAALVLGYLRQRIGLIPAIAAHMLANGCSLALAMS